MRTSTTFVLLLTALVAAASALPAQVPTDSARADAAPFTTLPTLGGAVDERVRVEQILGRRSPTGYLLRSPSTLQQAHGRTGRSLSLVAPELVSVWNSQLPESFNDGPLWAGRGLNLKLTAGVRAQAGRLSLVVAPQFVSEENRAYQTIPYPLDREPPRNPHASPFHYPPWSMDLPLRFGLEPRSRIDPGQSSLTLSVGGAAIGAATENLWWGPGIRNAILMSAHAPGIPHLFLRTARPWQTRLGTLEAQTVLGRLRESAYFDDAKENDYRSISAFAVVLHPRFEPDLAIGFARVVYAPAAERLPWGAALDAFRSVGRPNAPARVDAEPAADGMFSIFGRWVFPASGFEAYVEWARNEEPGSLRDFLEMPHHSQGYTLGLQWLRPSEYGPGLRLQGEATYLEPSGTYRVRHVNDWYSSSVVPQGYTHHGQVIGASIGPGASSQWLAADYLARNWQLGTFGGRIRWNNYVFHTYPPTYRWPDVSIFAGLRGGAGVGPVHVGMELSLTNRMNYLFQAQPVSDAEHRGVDIQNFSARLILSTRGHAR
jgi:hypothetical protein